MTRDESIIRKSRSLGSCVQPKWQPQRAAIEAFRRDQKITEATYYRWRKIYDGVGLDQVKKLKELEAENRRLRRAVSDLTVDNQILKEVARGNF